MTPGDLEQFMQQKTLVTRQNLANIASLLKVANFPSTL